MVKRISWFGLSTLLIVGGTTLFYCDFVRAGGTYKLEYPQGYGTCCPANSMEFGYFRTGWREWPGEMRRDKSFPRSIDMEMIPTPAGQKTVPPAKAEEKPKTLNEVPQGFGPEGGMEQPQGLLPGQAAPGEKPAGPGLELPTVPQEPGGFNPLPSLPPDLSAPKSQDGKETEEKKPDTESKESTEPKKEDQSKPESAPQTKTSEKSKTDVASSRSRPKNESTRTKSLVQNSVPMDSAKEKRLHPSPLPTAAAVPGEGTMTGNLPKVERTVRENFLKGEETKIDNLLKGESTITAAHPKGETAFGSGPELPASTPKIKQIDPIRDPSAIARGAVYHEAAGSATIARNSRDVVPQTFVQKVALDGFCPVELSLHGRWAPGDKQWTAAYKGFNYQFSGSMQRQEFLANPEKFIPANGGFDPVVSVAEERNVPGQVNFCATYKGRIYMFSTAATQEYFHKNPELYTGSTIR
jgi:YHS domain-containing protein